MRYAYLLARRGEKDRALQLVDVALKKAEQLLKDRNQSLRPPMEIAAIHCLRGENEAALNWLERAYSAGYRDHRTLALDPIFQSLREDSRFKRLLDRISADVAEMRNRANIPQTLSALKLPQ